MPDVTRQLETKVGILTNRTVLASNSNFYFYLSEPVKRSLELVDESVHGKIETMSDNRYG